MSRTMAAKSEQLLGVVRSAALIHEKQYYALQMARNPQARAEDMMRHQVELERSTARAIARNEAAARGPLHLPYSPTSPDMGGCTYVMSSEDDLFDSD